MDRNKLVKLEEQARSVEGTVPSKGEDVNTALEATIKSAELYFQALRLAENAQDKKRLDAKVNTLLAQAERLKHKDLLKGPLKAPLKAPIPTRKLTTRENIILLEGAKLNGFIFKPWTGSPPPDEFFHRDGASLFTDSRSLPLSAAQLESFDGWKRPHQALPCVQSDPNDQNAPGEAAVMHLPVAMDLVQDMTSDCSVVASLCALTSRVERGFPKILRSVVHPFDYEADRMILSANGRYVLKLYFNGCWRRVEIDDYLPSSKTARVLHVIDRRHPRLLWPALVEKAYLKVRGGYDFPGSNSGTDLAVLTGWIPQQVFLHDHDVEQDGLWEEIVKHFQEGNLLITLGTGKLPHREQRQLGLAAEHNYAVLDINADGDTKEMLIKILGRMAMSGKAQLDNDRTEKREGASNDEHEDDGMMPGTFWMDFNRVFQYFENMYLNWNTGLFSHRQDLHFSWDHVQIGTSDKLFIDNPQFVVQASQTGEVWLLLHRHLRSDDYTQMTAKTNGYVSLYLYVHDGNRVMPNLGAKMRGAFVDSPNTLLRIQAAANVAYTAVLVAQDLPPGKLNFTISAFSKSSVSLSEARMPYTQKYNVSSAWTRSNAGGNSDSANYLSNPQFRMSLSDAQPIALVLRILDAEKDSSGPVPTKACDINVKIIVVFSNGSRITRLRPRDVLAHSGDYRGGSAIIETSLGRGDYTIICSTFDQGQYADFSLDLYTSPSTRPETSLIQLPIEGAGRLSIKSNSATFGTGTTRLLAPLSILRMSRITFVARHGSSTATPAQSSLFKMTLEQGQGPYKHVIASSEVDYEEFSSVSSGLRMNDLDLQPSMCAPGTGGLWLVLERLALQGGQGNAGDRDEVLSVEMFTDERVELGVWGTGEG